MRIGNVYFTEAGTMFDLGEIAAAAWGNRENDVAFVWVRGQASDYGTMVAPGGGALLAAIKDYHIEQEKKREAVRTGGGTGREGE